MDREVLRKYRASSVLKLHVMGGRIEREERRGEWRSGKAI